MKFGGDPIYLNTNILKYENSEQRVETQIKLHCVLLHLQKGCHKVCLQCSDLGEEAI